MKHINTVTITDLNPYTDTIEFKVIESMNDRCLVNYFYAELNNTQQWALGQRTADKRTLNALVRRGIARKIYKPHHPGFPTDLKVVLTRRGERLVKAILENY